MEDKTTEKHAELLPYTLTEAMRKVRETKGNTERVVALIERAKRQIDAGVDPATVDEDTVKRIVAL
jgi:hypothetical protein